MFILSCILYDLFISLLLDGFGTQDEEDSEDLLHLDKDELAQNNKQEMLSSSNFINMLLNGFTVI